MKTMLLAVSLVAICTVAHAQTTPTSPASPPVTTPGAPLTPGAGPDAANSGPGATGAASREGTGAGTVTNNAAGGSNADQPARANPNTGKGGSSGSPGG